MEITTILASAIATGFNALAIKLSEKAAETGFDLLLSAPRADKQIKYQEHLENTFRRCSKTKTLINPYTPVDLMSLYVQGSFECKSDEYSLNSPQIIDDFAFIEKIWSTGLIALLGTAGSGKTFFTKYFWLSCFIKSNGKIPFYIELRKVNELSKEDLLTYIYHSVASENEGDGTQKSFNEAIDNGRFVFIFDGFDEVKEEKRKWLEIEILNLSRRNNKNVIVVTSRYDERFFSWQSFHCYNAMPMDKNQALKLIEKIEFDKSVKKKFAARVKNDLYDKHSSFLSSPLLATMMLLTFGAYADVPDKIHVFYEQAFDTLYARHDTLKESFTRDFHSKLKIDEFKLQFAYFCLITYDAEIYEFNETKIIEYLKEAKKSSGAEYDEGLFLKDLLESVCMLQKDGLTIVFSHRSFQEFFTSYLLVRMSYEVVGPLVLRYLKRGSDGVIRMLYDMNKEAVIEAYFKPAFNENRKLLAPKTRVLSLAAHSKKYGCSVEVFRFPSASARKNSAHSSPPISISVIESKYNHFVQILRIAKKFDNAAAILSIFGSRDVHDSEKYVKASNVFNNSLGLNLKSRHVFKYFENGVMCSEDEARAIEKFYKDSGYAEYHLWLTNYLFQECELLISSSNNRKESLATILAISK